MQTKEQIKNYMLKLISERDGELVSKTVKYFGKSKSTVYNYLTQMQEDGIIFKAEGGFELARREYSFSYDNTKPLSESRICFEDFEPLIASFPKNIISIWRYAFMEMMNNAIEHSRAEKIFVTVKLDSVKTTVNISDNGIGIFRNIQEYVMAERGEDMPLNECVALLFAGKFTTARDMHSGEGIFFTSHLMDDFLIFSDDIIFSRDNFRDEQINIEKQSGGTLVSMSLYNNAKKTAREVFDRFSNVDDGFIKTLIPIAHVFPNGDPISRSEARRLGGLIASFKEVELDFAAVEEVGQAFAHELFVVWKRSNPDVELKVLNTCDDVDFMIRRVINTK
ncbi:MAG: DUF4325 domain-containing protein [Clostridia bacterium]|nr:DUF4325 domain-containing protein [Clostridia bacterium]